VTAVHTKVIRGRGAKVMEVARDRVALSIRIDTR
jgi:hypothetical protein